MSNIIINPQSGILEFNTGAASGSALDSSLSGAARLKFESSGVLGLTSLGTGVTDKFTIDGSNGRLFTVNNTVTGSIFSVNDVAGLPIVEVFSDDRVVMGKYATDALVVSGSGVSFANVPTVSGNPIMTGVSSEDVDTLATVTARGATTTSSITTNGLTSNGNITTSSNGIGIFTRTLAARDGNGLAIRESTSSSGISISSAGNTTIDGHITVGNGKFIGQNETLSAIQFGNGSIGNEQADLSFVTDANGEFVFSRGGANKVIIGSTTNVSDGDFFVDTDTLYVDVSTNRIGIGLTTPDSTLHIQSASATAATINLESTHAGGIPIYNLKGAHSAQVRYQDENGNNQSRIDFLDGGDFNFIDATDGTSHLKINSNGKVGIGTNNPTYALHIDNNGNNNAANVLIDSTTLHDSSISFSHNGTFGYTIGSDETDRFFKISSGSALGTNDRLTVNGVGLKVEGIVQADVFNTKANDGNIIYRSDSRTFVGNAGNNGLIVLDNGNVGIGLTDPDVALEVDGNIRIPNQGKIAFGSAGTPSDYLQLYDVGAGFGNSLLKLVQDGNTRFSIEGVNGNVYMQGNVGIGTNNAGTKLHVRSSAADCILRLQAADSTTHNSTVSFGDNDSNGVGFIKYAHNGDSMRFATAGVEAVRIDSSQRVGIGTNSVLGTLQVNGRALVEGPSVPTTITISDSGDASKALRLGYEPTWDVGSISASDYGAGWKNIVIAPHAGKVGIGTTSPHQPLSVKGTIVSYNSSYVQVAGMTNSSNHGRLYANNSAGVTKVLLDTNGVSYFLGGNVGIGVNDPDEKLEVQGKTHLGSRGQDGGASIEYASFSETNGGASTILGNAVYAGTANNTYRKTRSDAGNYIQLNYNKGITFHTNVTGSASSTEYDINNHEQMRITTGGFVGIGTNNPQAELHVDGDVIIDTSTASKALYVTRLGNTNESLKINVDDSSAIFEVIQDENSAAYGNYHFKTDINDNTTYYRYDIGGSEVMRLTANGLEIKGNQNADHPRIHFQASDASNRFTIETDLDSTTTNDTLGFVGSFGQAYKKDILFLKGNGNVGIGTNNPQELLHVDGSSPRIRLRDSNAAGTPLAHIDASDGALKLQADSSDETADSFLTLEVDGGERVRVTSVGKVGIGTTDPLGTTHIYTADAGSAIVTNASHDDLIIENNGNCGIQLSSPASSYQYLAFGDTASANAGYVRYYHSDDSMVLRAGANDTVNIKGGLVGINNTDPATQLQVTANNSISAITIHRDGSNPSTNTSLGKIQFAQDYNSTQQNSWGQIELRTNASSVRTDMRFKVKSTSGNELTAMTLHGTASDDPRVGIGTAIPTSKLHVYGGDNTGLYGSIRNDFTNRMNMKVAMGSTTRYIGTVSQYGNGDSSGFTIRLYDGAEKVFRIVRVVVQNSGGTNVARATVEGGGEDTDIHINLEYKNRDGDATKTDFFLVPTSKSFTQYVEIEGYILRDTGWNTTSLTSVSLDDDLALNVLDSVNGSRVGVGTTDPSAKFHAEGSMIVKGDAGWAGTDNQNGALFMNTAGRGLLGAFSTSYARNLITANSNYIDLGSAGTSLINGVRYYAGSSSSSVGTHDFYTNGSNNRLHIAKDGKVGIGSETPAEVLDVVGLIRFAHTRANNSQKIGRLLVPEYNNSHGQFVAFMGTANETSNAVSYGGGTSSADAATTLLFYTASAVNTTVGTERMRITSAGNVGIGVSGDPSDKLEVNGSFSASSKTFNIEHPTKSGKRLIHGCFEGPEYGVYFRGKTQDNCIKAPEYWSGLVDIDSMTVDITPIGPNQNIYVDRIEDNGDIYVGANTDEPLNYFYVVYGERKDIDKLEIVKDAPVASPNQVVD